MAHSILRGDCRVSFGYIPDGAIGLGLTDPPYEIGISGKSWDSSGIAYDRNVWSSYLRVLAPGAHLLVFCASRTYHRVACAVEDVGFEIRDQGQWLYASGAMPKGRNISKAIDALYGAERPVLEYRTHTAGGGESYGFQKGAKRTVQANVTGPATPQAASWEGWNTSLCPAHEPFLIARKPLAHATVERNVLQYGTGAMNVRAGEYRVPHSDTPLWPKNVIISHAYGCGPHGCVPGCPARMLDTQMAGAAGRFLQLPFEPEFDHDIFCNKPTRDEKDIGCWHLPRKAPDASSTMSASPQARERNAAIEAGEVAGLLNFHPTTKPVNLMSYLVGIFGVPGLPVLDAFAGSGTTGVAAIGRGMEFIGCELTPDYWPIIEARCSFAERQYAQQGVQR